MRLAANIDANQREICEGLKKAGRSILYLHPIGSGCPDILVGYHGKNILLEIKQLKGQLNDNQKEFFAAWRGQALVVRTLEEALEATK